SLSMIAGVLIALGIILFIVLSEGRAPQADLPIVSLLAVVMMVLNTPMAFVVPRITAQNRLRELARQSTPSPADLRLALLDLRQSTLIISLALLEGTAFLAIVAFLLEVQVYVLGIVGLMLLVMLGQFPTETRVLAWMEMQLQRLAELRQ